MNYFLLQMNFVSNKSKTDQSSEELDFVNVGVTAHIDGSDGFNVIPGTELADLFVISINLHRSK